MTPFTSLLLAGLFFLWGCVAGSGGGTGLYGDSDALARLNLSARGGRAGTPGVMAGGRPTQVVYFNDAGNETQVGPGVQAVGQGYTVNLQGVTVDVAAKSLTQLGITEINLRTDATLISFADGSQITGQTTFTMGGVVKTAAAVTLVSEADGHKLETTVDGATTIYVTKDTAGHVVSVRAKRRKRSITGWHWRNRNVHAWTFGMIAKSQETINVPSWNGNVEVQRLIRGKR